MVATYSAFGREVSLTWGYLELHVGNLQRFWEGSFSNLGLLGTACWQPTALLGGKFL